MPAFGAVTIGSRFVFSASSMGDEALLGHLLQNQVAALARAIGMTDRIVVRLRFRQSGERRRFGERQLRGRMAKIVARPRLDAEPAASEVDLIDVRFEDLILGVVLLHLARGGLFVELASES